MNAADIRPPEPWEMASPMNAFRYAFYVVKSRWPKGEPVIMQAPPWACEYAKDVIKGRWPEAEETISQSIPWAYFYARDVIKDRWPEGEAAIAKSTWKEHYLMAHPEVADDWAMNGWIDWLDT